MHIDTATKTHAAEDRPAARRHASLTVYELMQLGLFRVGYVTQEASAGHGTEIVVHGANGMAIATVDSVERALDIADYLGLALVPVH